MQRGSWICTQAVIEGLTGLALGCTGGKFKQPEVRGGRVVIRSRLRLPLLSWAPRGGNLPRTTRGELPGDVSPPAALCLGGVRLFGLAGLGRSSPGAPGPPDVALCAG